MVAAQEGRGEKDGAGYKRKPECHTSRSRRQAGLLNRNEVEAEEYRCSQAEQVAAQSRRVHLHRLSDKCEAAQDAKADAGDGSARNALFQY